MRYLSFVFILFLLPKLQGQDSPAWDLLVTDAQIFTGTKVLKQTDLAVKDGKIVAMGPELDRQRSATETLNANGKMLLPGLMNTHVHAWFSAHLQMAAQAGVLGVCDMHGSSFATQWLGQFKDSIGYATYHAAGPGATVPEGHGTQFGLIVPTIDSTTSARQFVLNRKAESADYIKILLEHRRPTLTYEQVDTIIKTAHENGLQAVAHVSRCEDAVELAKRGIDGLVHIWLDRRMTEEELEVFATRDDLFIVPTALTYIKLMQVMKEQGTAMENMLDSASLLQEVVRLYEAGVDVLAGTDPPNFNINYGTDLYAELCLLKDAGIPAEDCLAGATA
ncbi:MAG: amidohydrolase, partial [Bacteroidota bacterium]